MDEEIKIMLDMETYGTHPGCKLMTISAVTFGFADSRVAQECFHINIDRGMQSYLKEDQATLDWWAEQDQEVFKRMTAGGTRLGEALNQFSMWLAKFPRYTLWCKPAAFDVPILEAAYKASGMTAPWNFRAVRCYRTLEAEFGHLVTLPAFEGNKHDSLHDAVHQAKCADLILRRIYNAR